MLSNEMKSCKISPNVKSMIRPANDIIGTVLICLSCSTNLQQVYHFILCLSFYVESILWVDCVAPSLIRLASSADSTKIRALFRVFFFLDTEAINF